MNFMGNIYRFVLVLAFLYAGCAFAQSGEDGGDRSISVKMDVRFDGEFTGYGKDDITGERPSSDAGFVGRYLKILADGKINDKFSYSFRHRLYIDNGDTKSFFNSTDWANVT